MCIECEGMCFPVHLIYIRGIVLCEYYDNNSGFSTQSLMFNARELRLT